MRESPKEGGAFSRMKGEGGREGGRTRTWISSDCSAPMRATSSSYMILMNSWSGVTPFVTSMPRGEGGREGGREGGKEKMRKLPVCLRS